MKRIQILSVACLCAITLASTTASADELIVDAQVATSYYSDPSFDAISTYDSLSNVALGAAWSFDELDWLRLGLRFQTMPRLQESRFAGDIFTEYGRQKFLATVEVGTPFIWSWLRPFVFGSVGYAHSFLSVTAFGPRLKDHAHDLAGSLAGGIDFPWRFKFGTLALTTSVGYEMQTTGRFDEMRHDKDAFEFEYAPEDDPWDRAHGDYGTLRTSGVYWTIGARMSFNLL